MNAIRTLLVFALVWTGCTDENLIKSIEFMNEGAAAYRKGAFSTAAQHFEEATEVYPDNHQAWFYLGMARTEDGDWEKTVTAMQEAVRVKTAEPMYQMFLGIALYESGQQSMAASHLERAIELENRLYRAHWYLGSIYADNDEPEKAAQSWTQSAQLNPGWGRPYVSLGILYLKWDLISDAIAVLEPAKLHADTEYLPNIYYYLGLAYDIQKNWDQSIDAYTKAITSARDLQTDNIEARFQRGLAYVRKGNHEQAIQDLEDVSKSTNDPFIKQQANEVLLDLVVTE